MNWHTLARNDRESAVAVIAFLVCAELDNPSMAHGMRGISDALEAMCLLLGTEPDAVRREMRPLCGINGGLQ